MKDIINSESESTKNGIENNTTTADSKIQWHQGFYSSIELELNRYKDSLVFETEHELSRKPLRIDMLVIRKNKDIQIDNPIGAYFKKYNIVEYKSPDDGMTIDDFYKVIGYTGIYKSLGKTSNEIPAEEISITMVRHSYPRELMKNLDACRADIIEETDGIFRVEGMFYIPIYIIVTSRLSGDHPGLKMLSKSVERDDLSRFIAYARRFKSKGDKELINSILEISTRANIDIFEKYKEEKAMGEALRELMREEILESENKGRAEGRVEGRTLILEALVKDGTITIEKARELEKRSII